MMSQDIWISKEWMNNQNICIPGRRTGLRLRIDKNVHPEVKAAYKQLANWIRERFLFPIRVPAYIKCSERIKARDGEYCVALFFRPDDYSVEPYIRIATGDYKKLEKTKGALQAKIAILLPLFHELTHYFQWINSVEKTKLGEEQQAIRYAHNLMEEYLDDLASIYL